MAEMHRSSVMLHHVNHLNRSLSPGWPNNDKSVPKRIHLVLQSRLATTLSQLSLKYLPTNARGWTDHFTIHHIKLGPKSKPRLIK